ncbi:MAG: type II toxin-antitoxin system HicB family antitoxin [Gemmataceae bacterium]|nr:type II toxin-antitoxin system HicB family antitoxin [Gemmataceae bacterium]
MLEGMEKDMKIEVVIHKADEGGYWAEVPALAGCYSQGETLAEVKKNLREAIRGWLTAASRRKGAPRTSEVRVQEIEV